MINLFLICLLLSSLLFAGCRQEFEKPKLIQKENKVQREIFDVKKYPELTTIGRINFVPRKQCTLTLVAEDIAVTAGHCFLEEYHLSDMSKDLDSLATSVIFRYDGVRRFENISVKRVLRAKMKPDYAIVRLNKKIDRNLLKPLKFEKMSLEEMLSNEQNLGCAGFNGDKELGDGGFTMTISRSLEIFPETSSKERVDTNCISTHGGSGGAFFLERQNAETKQKEYVLLGVIWGVTDDKFDLKGELVNDVNSVTSITPVSVFYDELTEVLEANKP